MATGNENAVYLLFVRGQAAAIRTPRTTMSNQEDKKYERRMQSTAGLPKA